ncbi:putative peptide transport permease Mb1314c domain protein [Mycobacterium xenopi 3993]|nr:putative peptide transport permease Mb1314c domain protein [Mycobacterium xenopi 3993]
MTVLSIPSFVLAGLLILAGLRVNDFTGLRIFLYTGETSPIPAGGVGHQLVDRPSTSCCRP